jgi:phosphate transport system substrate-binding protein
MPHLSATHFSIVDAPGAQSYPISGYSWMIVRQHGTKTRALTALIRWLVTTGQRYAGPLDYVPLPSDIQALALHQLAKLR